MKSRNLRP